MRRLLPKSLFGQTVLVLLIGLTVSHLVSMAVYSSDRVEVLTLSGGEETARRIASIARLIDQVPPEWRDRILDTVQSPTLRVALGGDGALVPQPSEDWRGGLIRRFLAREMQAAEGDVVVRLEGLAEPPVPSGMMNSMMGGQQRHMHMGWFSPRMVEDWPIGAALQASVRLSDGQWLNFAAAIPDPPRLWSAPAILSLGLMVVTVVAFSLWAVRRLTGPIRTFAQAADRLGRDVKAPPLAESGPVEIRQAARAFNGMQARLRRLVENRTRMLAAISHDLRTPITQLRLRAEFIDDVEEQAKTLATLEDMEAMIASTLTFARDDALTEAPRTVDLPALVGSLCDDLADAGKPVFFQATEKIAVTCRPAALKRAVANLVENAVKYGGCARVSIVVGSGEGGVAIVVEDDGPGLPIDELENVFAPFYRVEKSRGSGPGGVGLGLSIVQAVADAHGGRVRLENRQEGGLRAILEFPR
ncbi:MAG: ATP-binding protein [Rhodospirillales bacterium]|jgi:signal transduction histidine kinase|nr:ATP-binding protein [Rhodospirillales bacterium]